MHSGTRPALTRGHTWGARVTFDAVAFLAAASLFFLGVPSFVLAAPPQGAPSSLAGSSVGRGMAADIQAAHARVDDALRMRQQRLEVWRRAVAERDRAASGVTALKRRGVGGAELESMLRRTLKLDEDAARARTALFAADSQVSTVGAALLRLYDAALVDKRRSVEALSASSPARAQAVTTYRGLAAQRDAVRAALAPVLIKGAQGDGAVVPPGVNLEAGPDDDVETLIEKAELARDLEQRVLRQAEQVRRRIAELEEERAIADDVAGMMSRSQLFDEEDRRMLLFRTETPRLTSPASASVVGEGEAGRAESGADASPPMSAAPAPASDGAIESDGPSILDSAVAVGAVAAPAPIVVRGEQVIGVQAVGSLDVQVSVEKLRELELRLKSQARRLRDKSTELAGQAARRPH